MRIGLCLILLYIAAKMGKIDIHPVRRGNPGDLYILKEFIMADTIDENQEQGTEDLKKVEATADEKQRRHRVDEYMAMIIALGAVAVLWLLQYLGFY